MNRNTVNQTVSYSLCKVRFSCSSKLYVLVLFFCAHPIIIHQKKYPKFHTESILMPCYQGIVKKCLTMTESAAVAVITQWCLGAKINKHILALLYYMQYSRYMFVYLRPQVWRSYRRSKLGPFCTNLDSVLYIAHAVHVRKKTKTCHNGGIRRSSGHNFMNIKAIQNLKVTSNAAVFQLHLLLFKVNNTILVVFLLIFENWYQFWGFWVLCKLTFFIQR